MLGHVKPRHDTAPLGSSRGHGDVARAFSGHLDPPYETSTLGGDPHDRDLHRRALGSRRDIGSSREDVFRLNEERTFGPNAKIACDKLRPFPRPKYWEYMYLDLGVSCLFHLRSVRDTPPPSVDPGQCKIVYCSNHGLLRLCSNVGLSSIHPFLFPSRRY